MTTTALFLSTVTYRRGDQATFSDTDFLALFTAGKVEKVFDEALVSVYPAAVTNSANGASCDFQYAGDRFRATQVVGVVTGTNPSLAGKLQESANGTDWTDMTGGAFTAVTASSDEQELVVTKTAGTRHIRHVRTITGTDTPTFNLSVLIEAIPTVS